MLLLKSFVYSALWLLEMSNKRVLIVDDSCLFQRLLSEVISAHKGMEVVGVASNGKIALSMMESTRPDVVTLDILMPEMDGFQTLIELRKNWPDVKTLMISSLTSEGSDAALDALALGASEHASKPSSGSGINSLRECMENDILAKVEALCGLEVQKVPPIAKAPAQVTVDKAALPRTASTSAAIDLIAIGVSTGGPDALAKLLSTLPGDIGVPIVIVQHMPAEFTAKLATRLDTVSKLTVVEAQLGHKLRAGTVYIAPGNYHMVLDQIDADVIVSLNMDQPENSCRPSVDPLFRSIPPIYRNRCLGVIMTGMGADGLNGCQELSAEGCPIIVQDQVTSVVWGMPKLVAMAGLALEQVPIDELSDVITRYVRGSQVPEHLTAANSDKYNHSAVAGRRS